MAVIRIPEHIYQETFHHLFNTHGEHFAFFLASWSSSQSEPIFLVKDVLCIPNSLVKMGWDGFQLTTEGILLAVNAAVKGGHCLIEIHNHGGSTPRWSDTDLAGLEEFVNYIHDSLPDRPYAATVWGEETIFGEYFLPNGRRGQLRSITAFGDRFSQLISINGNYDVSSNIFDRQKVWFSQTGQRQLARIRIGIVGCGGTGSHLIQQLAYLGCRDFVIIDDDYVEDTNLNRLVTATPADIGIPKIHLGSQTIRKIAPTSNVVAIRENIQTEKCLDVLKGVDIIFGCVDNDGARLILNELALAYNIPYIDLATEILTKDAAIVEIGGRVAFVTSNGPCLLCMGEIDSEEASFFLSNQQDREQQLERGYVAGINIKNPSVVSLNGQVATTAINEFAIYISGLRHVNPLTIINVLGNGRGKNSQWITPQTAQTAEGCVQCVVSGIGDNSGIQRYAKK